MAYKDIKELTKDGLTNCDLDDFMTLYKLDIKSFPNRCAVMQKEIADLYELWLAGRHASAWLYLAELRKFEGMVAVDEFMELFENDYKAKYTAAYENPDSLRADVYSAIAEAEEETDIFSFAVNMLLIIRKVERDVELEQNKERL